MKTKLLLLLASKKTPFEGVLCKVQRQIRYLDKSRERSRLVYHLQPQLMLYWLIIFLPFLVTGPRIISFTFLSHIISITLSLSHFYLTLSLSHFYLAIVLLSETLHTAGWTAVFVKVMTFWDH